MAYDFAIKEGMKDSIPAIWTRRSTAGSDWYYGFMKRHRNISLRTPHSISIQRVKGFNKESVDAFYSQLDALYNEHQYPLERIWNMDETGFPTVPCHVQKLLAETGSKHVGCMSSAERGTNVSCALAVNAAGQCIPPFFIFPRANMQSIFMATAQSSSAGEANASGYMQQAEFYKFMVHFVKYSHASKDKPTLLLLDNHTSHLSIAAIDKAIEFNITMLTFPPHCTHKMQPLDRGVIGPVKARYVAKHDSWMKANGGKTFELYHVPSIVEACLDECATAANIKSAFKRTGVFEFNRNIFTEDDFFAAKKIAEANARAEMTQEQIEDSGLERVLLVLDENIPIGSETELDSTDGTDASSPFDSKAASTSVTDFGHLSRTSSMNSNLNSAGPVRIYGKKKSNRGQPAVKSAVLTTPEKRNQLHDAAAKRSAKKRQSEEKAKNGPVKRGRPKKNASTNQEKTTPKTPKKQPKKQTKKQPKRQSKKKQDKDEDRGVDSD